MHTGLFLRILCDSSKAWHVFASSIMDERHPANSICQSRRVLAFCRPLLPDRHHPLPFVDLSYFEWLLYSSPNPAIVFEHLHNPPRQSCQVVAQAGQYSHFHQTRTSNFNSSIPFKTVNEHHRLLLDSAVGENKTSPISGPTSRRVGYH